MGPCLRFSIPSSPVIALFILGEWKLTATTDSSIIYNCLLACSSSVDSPSILFMSERVFWRRLCLLTIAMLLLPNVSADYRLVFLLLPLGLFVREGKPSRYDLLLCWLFGCLLIPKNYLILDQDRNIGMLLNPLLLLLLTITLILHRYEEQHHPLSSTALPAMDEPRSSASPDTGRI